jgi:hypothetical protein
MYTATVGGFSASEALSERFPENAAEMAIAGTPIDAWTDPHRSGNGNEAL